MTTQERDGVTVELEGSANLLGIGREPTRRLGAVGVNASGAEAPPQVGELALQVRDLTLGGVARGVWRPRHLEDREQLGRRWHVAVGRTHLPHRHLAPGGWLPRLAHPSGELLLGEARPLASRPDELGHLAHLLLATFLSAHRHGMLAGRAGNELPRSDGDSAFKSVISPLHDGICHKNMAYCYRDEAHR